MLSSSFCYQQCRVITAVRCNLLYHQQSIWQENFRLRWF